MEMQDMQLRLNQLRDPNHVRPPSGHADDPVPPPSLGTLKDKKLWGKADRYLHSSKITDPAEDSPTIERRSFIAGGESQHQSPDEPITTHEQDAHGKTTRTTGRGRDYKLPRRDISEYLAEKQRLKKEIRRKKKRNCLIAVCVLVTIIVTVTLIVLLTQSPDEESSVTFRTILTLSTVELTSTALGAITQTSSISVVEPCEGMSCGEHGTCDKGICMCDDGYTGESCETEIDPCLSQPCDVDFKCVQAEVGYTCECYQNCDAIPGTSDTGEMERHREARNILLIIVFAVTIAVVALIIFLLFQMKKIRRRRVPERDSS